MRESVCSLFLPACTALSAASFDARAACRASCSALRRASRVARRLQRIVPGGSGGMPRGAVRLLGSVPSGGCRLFGRVFGLLGELPPILRRTRCGLFCAAYRTLCRLVRPVNSPANGLRRALGTIIGCRLCPLQRSRHTRSGFARRDCSVLRGLGRQSVGPPRALRCRRRRRGRRFVRRLADRTGGQCSRNQEMFEYRRHEIFSNISGYHSIV